MVTVTGGAVGKLFSCVLALALFGGPAHASSDLVMHSFGQATDGANPLGSLIKVGGLYYGTTSAGGTLGGGTVYSMTPQGVEHVIYNFGSATKDGSKPLSGLLDIDGTFYGTTSAGGTHGLGTVYSITPQGGETVLYSFGASGDGAVPNGDLVYANGGLYGTTQAGGAQNLGTVFFLPLGGQETIIHSFAGGASDGATPMAGLTRANDVLYGTTSLGGAANLGTVFSVSDLAATDLHVVYAFKGNADGANPNAPLVIMDGTLYGTTLGGGQVGNDADGTVFSLQIGGQSAENVIYRFAAFGAQGGIAPGSALIGLNGVLYGTTSAGGPYNDGTLFSLSPNGVATVLHTTLGGIDGAGTPSALKYGGAAFYGVRAGGGSGGKGVAYRFITPFIKASPVITSVSIVKDGSTYTATIKGRNFGKAPVALPCENCNIQEMYVQVLIPAGGVSFTLQRWNDTEILLTGMTGSPRIDAGNGFAFAVENKALGTTASAFGAVPGGQAGPVMTGVTLSNIGANLHITVTGRGFGQAPPGVPGITDTSAFGYIGWATGAKRGPNYPFGFGNGGNTTTAKYTYWSDTKIEISGFAGTYGFDGCTIGGGDAGIIYMRIDGTVGRAFNIQ